MPTPRATVRIPPELDAAVREARPELADATPSVLIRAALALAAGWPIGEALAATRERPGPGGLRRNFGQGTA